MSRNTGMFTLAAVVSLFMAGLANAASTAINVDFNSDPTGAHNVYTFTPAVTYVGLGAGPDVVTNTFWNGVDIFVPSFFTVPTFTSSGTLLMSDGTTTTGASFTLTNYGPQNQQGFYGPNVSIAPDLFGDDVYYPGGTISTYTINGLVAGIPYDLYLYSMGEYPNSNNTVFTVDGVAGSTDITGLPATYGSAFASVAAGTTGGGNYVLYSHVIATGGTISGTFSGGNSRFDGFQLIEAPEPASLGLLLAGGVMLLRRRRGRTFFSKERIMNHNTGMFALVAVVSLFMADLTNAASTAINVDFNTTGGTSGTYSGTGAAPDSGTTWNGVTAAAISSLTSGTLLASDGSSTPVTVTIGNYGAIDAHNQLGFDTPFATALFNDFIYDGHSVNGGPATFTLNHLDPGAPYTLYLYSMTAHYVGSTTFVINGNSLTVASDPAVYGFAFNDATTDAAGNYVVYSHVAAALDGTISGTITSGPGGGRLNGFQLLEVPEPASLGLLLASGVMLLRRRRA